MINWERIAELQQEVGEDAFAEVLGMFFEEFEENLATFDAGIDKDGFHLLKGSAANVGLAEVADLCQAAEQAVMAGHAGGPFLERIRTSFAASRGEMAEMMP